MRFLLIVTAACVWLVPSAAAAQETADPTPPAHVSFVDGAAVIERDGKTDSAPANVPLLAGDRIRTDEGRVEILFADGSTLHVDFFTTVDFQSDDLVRVLAGRVRLTIAGRQRDVAYRIDGPNAWAQIAQPGEYRFAITRNDRGAEVELAVLRGTAELVNDDGRTALRAGERALVRAGEAPSYPYVFNTSAWDAFDRWSEARRDHRLGLSTQYLPEPVQAYSRTFDHYGSWRHEPAYGYVWYPTVSVGWRPYYHGRWNTYRPWGWFWVGSDPWAWPTHHYGRWGFSTGSWFWIPGRTWGPAWVSWAYAPGYVSWCPLGWNNRAVFAINGYHGYYDPWRAWTVVPYGRFGHGYVHHRAVNWHTVAPHGRLTWAHGAGAPTFRGYAVPRSTTAIRAAGRAVPRGGGTSAPVYTNLPRDASRVQTDGPRRQVGETGGSRAVPRGDGAAAPLRADVPRVVPERGVRSAPVIRADDGGSPGPMRAMPREPNTRPEPAPFRSTDAERPSYSRRPPDQPRRDAGAVDSRPDAGVRAVPRSAPGVGWVPQPNAQPGPNLVPDRRSIDVTSPRTDDRMRAQPGSAPGPSNPGFSVPRAPERRAPEGGAPPSPQHAVPRASPGGPPAPRFDPPQRSMERQAPSAPPNSAGPPPSRPAPPSGGGRSGGGAARRR